MGTYILRKHRGSLTESMKTVQKFSTLYDLINFVSINKNFKISHVSISIYDYKKDSRINWDYTYIVCVDSIPYGFFTYKINK